MAVHHIRWMIRRDLDEVLAIEQASFDDPWPESKFVKTLRSNDAVGMVVELNGQVAGYIVYELSKHSTTITNMAVHPQYRRIGVGSVMVERLKQAILVGVACTNRSSVFATVRERNVVAQLFLKSRGLLCIRTMRGYYSDGSEDAYVMRWHKAQELASMELAGKE